MAQNDEVLEEPTGVLGGNSLGAALRGAATPGWRMHQDLARSVGLHEDFRRVFLGAIDPTEQLRQLAPTPPLEDLRRQVMSGAKMMKALAPPIAPLVKLPVVAFDGVVPRPRFKSFNTLTPKLNPDLSRSIVGTVPPALARLTRDLQAAEAQIFADVYRPTSLLSGPDTLARRRTPTAPPAHPSGRAVVDRRAEATGFEQVVLVLMATCVVAFLLGASPADALVTTRTAVRLLGHASLNEVEFHGLMIVLASGLAIRRNWPG